MLCVLQIDNVAVIEHAEIAFDAGLNVLTGETGAGKSIIIDSISAILGARTYRDLIRTGCAKASVSAIFRLTAEPSWFGAHGIAYSEEFSVQRELYADGRNICRVNGQIVTVAALKELGAHLVGIHGQNDTQTLFDEQTHLFYLDALSPSCELKQRYSEQYAAYSACAEQVRRLSTDSGERLRRLEMLQYQIREIEAAALHDGEDTELEDRKKILLNAEKLTEGLNAAVGALYGDENGDGAADLLSRAERELNRLIPVGEAYRQKAEQLSQLQSNLRELARELRDEAEDISYSSGELEEIETRLDLLKKLKRKYGATVAEILQYCDAAKEEAAALDLSDETLEQKKQECEKLRAAVAAVGAQLREERQASAARLKDAMEAELSQLAMPNFRFQVEFEPTEPTENGLDFVRFLMSANIGESLRPLSKIASGGELARVMLALENVLSAKERIPTMIFDEVDAGVSGRAAQKVAEKLHEVAVGKQVLCVTHLAQIAAMADAHLLISKSAHDGRTYTTVENLAHEGRVEELARIIGGADITENTRKSAEEMLKR